mmetsp:Transcript_81226/g.169701  ORF Transcript_81226/g.169701 Transcript_81226/m.169701 type:complete len:124 (-) Transcript_81226:1080-1451(-)
MASSCCSSRESLSPGVQRFPREAAPARPLSANGQPFEPTQGRPSASVPVAAAATGGGGAAAGPTAVSVDQICTSPFPKGQVPTEAVLACRQKVSEAFFVQLCSRAQRKGNEAVWGRHDCCYPL